MSKKEKEIIVPVPMATLPSKNQQTFAKGLFTRYDALAKRLKADKDLITHV
jgi:hypothetical protein